MPTVLITGANRGLGLEFTRQYSADGWRVIATCRKPDDAQELAAIAGNVDIHALDVTDIEGLRDLGKKISEPINFLIVNAGRGTRGEGEFGNYDYDVWKGFLDVNLYGAVATAEVFTPHVRQAGGKSAFISSKMGSISDASGGAMAYRTSKTALNMAARVVAGAVSGFGVPVGVYHPGWVETDMGGPNALIDTKTSISGLRALFEKMPITPAPKFLAYDGAEIPW